MSIESGVAGLTTRTFFTKIVIYGLGAVASVLIARALGPTGRGAYYVPVTIATTAFYIGNLGAEQAQFRLWSQQRGGRDTFITAGRILGVVLGLTTAAVTWLLYVLLRTSLFPELEPVHVAIAVATIPIQIHSLLSSGLLIVSGRLDLNNAAFLAGAFVQVAGISVAAAVTELSVTTVLVFYAASVITPWLVMVWGIRTIGRFRRPIRWAFVREQLALGSKLQPYLVFSYLNLRIDVFFVTTLAGLEEVGIYSVAVLFAELLWLVTDSLTYSVASRQANSPSELAIQVTTRAARSSLVLAVGGAIALALLGPLLIIALYGDPFRASRLSLWALLPGAVAMSIWRPLGALLVREASPWLQSQIALAAVAVNIVGNVVFVPRLGAVGAGLSSSISYTLGAGLAMAWLVRHRDVGVTEFIPRMRDVRAIHAALRPRVVFSRLSGKS